MKRAATEHCCSLDILRPRELLQAVHKTRVTPCRALYWPKAVSDGWLVFMAVLGSPKCLLSNCVKILFFIVFSVFLDADQSWTPTVLKGFEE